MLDPCLFEPANHLIPANLIENDSISHVAWINRKLSIARFNKDPNAIMKNKEIIPITEIQHEEESKSEVIQLRPPSIICDPSFASKIVYERYRPTNLKELRELIEFYTKYRHILPNTTAKQE